MSFVRPTLSELVDRIQQDMVSRLDLVGGALRRSLVSVFARVWAGATHTLHGHLEYISQQIFPDQSEVEFLTRQASLYGLSRNPASFATASVTFTGTSGTVPQGTVLQRSDGAEFTLDADASIDTGFAYGSVTATLAGSSGTLAASQTLALQSPVAGIDSTATVSASLQDGTDQETDDEFRARLLDRLQNPPQGGATADYVEWALSVPGVTRVWVYPLELGAGTVVVRFMRDDDSGSAIPDSGEVAAVQTFVNTVRPVTAAVTVAAPIADVLNFTIHVNPNTTAVQAAVQAELVDLLRRSTAPSTTLPLSAIRTAIGIADGLTDYALTSPSADVAPSTGHIPTMGTITWV